MVLHALLKEVRVPFLCNGTLISQEIVEKISVQFSYVLSDADVTFILAFIVRRLLITQEAYRHHGDTKRSIWFEYHREDVFFINNFYRTLFEEYKKQNNTEKVTIQHVVDDWIEKKLQSIQIENVDQHTTCCNPMRCDNSDSGNNKENKIVNNRALKRIPNSNTQDMACINGGKFLLGTDYEEAYVADGECPVREVTISSFYMDTHLITNEQFSQFVYETEYVTEAEIFGHSFVFWKFISEHRRKHDTNIIPVNEIPWWLQVPKTYWAQPEGEGSNINDRMNHPVVHVSYNDVCSYCAWAQKRLPTEAEWESAARGGSVQNIFPWGNELTLGGICMANTFQGAFPTENTEEDGYAGTSPVGTYPSNAFGLYDMIGNVWEWCFDFWQTDHSANLSTNPVGALQSDMNAHVIKGGSYLCHESWCHRYRVAARTCNTANSSAGNLGFRCVSDV